MTRMKARSRILEAALWSAAAAGAGWLSIRYRRDMRRARTRVALGGRVVHTRCGAVEYAETGNGPAVLVIHGAGGGYDQGLALGGALAALGYRVIAPSRFGYLRTPAPAHPSLALQAEAHAGLLDALGVPDAAVMGVSAGAPSAIEFALRYPQRCTRLILLVPAGARPSRAASPGALRRVLLEGALRTDFLYWAMSHLAPEIIEQTVLGTPPAALASVSDRERKRAAMLMHDISPLSQRRVGLSLEAQLIDETRTQALENISTPTLAVSAEDDGYGTYQNAQRIAARVRHGRFLAYRTGGHLLVGHNDEVTPAIAAFLNERSAISDGSGARLA